MTRTVAKKKRSSRKSAKARAVLNKPAVANLFFPTDEESVALRRSKAHQEAARVERIRMHGDFYGDFRVTSTQWEEPYQVEIRSLDRQINTCACRDFHMNGLGTCKHIERVLQVLARRRKRAFTAAADQGSPVCEVYLDRRHEVPRIVLVQPATGSRKARAALSPLFGEDGTLLSEPRVALPVLERIARALPAQVRLSFAIPPWVEEAERRRQRQRARTHFMEDGRKGKRALDILKQPLYPYQHDGMLHLAFTERALLADEMGLGKTVQAIAACELLRQLRGIQRVLVVCPSSLKTEWDEQIRQFTDHDAPMPVFGPRVARLKAYDHGPLFSIINYEQARADVNDINARLAPDVVILDEAQRIKNWPTKTAKTIKRLQSPYAFVLTGTPMENRIDEVYSLVEFVDPNLFGSLFRFQREFFQQDTDGNVAPHNLPELHRRLNAIMLRRLKADVEGDLPGRTNKTFFVPMEKEQRLRYQDYEESARRLAAQAHKRPLRKEEFEKLQMLLNCMRMTCDTPYILDSKCRICPKLLELEPILDEILSDPSAKVIVFSEWLRMLELVREWAEQKGVDFALHTGQVEQRKRRLEIQRFKTEPGCRLFLSSETGGTGLNLQAANYVINMDLPWNPAKLEQRIARAWRKHQTRAVTVINLVTEESIEHAMLGKLAYKQGLSKTVLDGATATTTKPPSGRKAYMAMVNDLLADKEDAGPVPPLTREGGSSLAPSTPSLQHELAARFPAQIVGMAADDQEQPRLVVVRDADQADAVRRVAHQTHPTTDVEILDRETYALLERLQSKGLIALKSTLQTPEGERHTTPPVERTYPAKACAHWGAAERKRKMGRVLVEAGLMEESRTPVQEAFQIGVQALYIFAHGSLADTPQDALVRDDRCRRLLKRLNLYELCEAPADNPADAVAREDTLRTTLAGLDRLDALLHKEMSHE